MATIGTFTKIENGFEGKIATLAANTRAKLVPIENPGDKGPQFRVYAGAAEIGAAWEKVSTDGVAYLSVKLDDPTFAKPIYARLFLAEGAKYDLVWSR